MIASFLLLVLAGLAVLTICGLGPYWLWGRAIPLTGLARLGLCSALGLILLGGVATQVFYLEIAPVWTVVLAALASGLLAWHAVRRGPTTLRQELTELWGDSFRDVDLGVAGVFVMLCLFSPGYRTGFVQPYRLGIDEVGYGVTADYLAQGGTKSSLRSEIARQTAQPNLPQALNAHVTALSFNVGVASEFLLKAHRLGYPTLLAGLAQLLGLDPVVDYQFCLLAVPWACALLLLVWFFGDVLGLPRMAAKMLALGLALNCNQLNVLFEGQHAQIVTLPLLVLFFGLLYVLRSGLRPGLFPLVALTGAGIFALYSDAFIALGTVGVVLFLADVIMRDWTVVRRTAGFGAGILLGMLGMGWYFVDWVGFMHRHLSNLGAGNGGWPQPHWASPAEVAGYFSMFTGILGQLQPRAWTEVVVEGLVALLMVVALVVSKVWRGPAGRFWLAPLVVCIGVFVDLCWVKGFHNYGYTKTFTILLVPLVGLHWVSLHAACAGGFGWWRAKVGPRAAVVTAVAAAAAAYTGINEALHFSRTSASLPLSVRELRALDRKIDLSGFAILTVPEGGIPTAMLGAYVRFHWLNISWADKKLAPHGEKEVLIVAFRDQLTPAMAAGAEARAFYAGRDFVVLPTGRRVRDLDLPEMDILADRPTTSIQWPHAQPPKMTAFLDAYLKQLSAPVTGVKP